jgi:hypothetical protein
MRMNSTLLCVALVSTLAIGCGRAAVTGRAPSAAPAKIAKTAAIKPIEEKAADLAEATAPAEVKAPARAVGDFIVHRFSGSFRDAPLTLTQRVIAREGDVLVIDMTLDEGSSRQTLRVRMDDSPAKRGDVVRVSRMVEGLEKEASIELFEEMMAKTALAADQNEEVLGSEDLTVDVGGTPMAAQKTSFRVRLGKVQATLKTVQSDRFAWGDLGGEITTASGDVIYRAELVEAGNGDAPKAPAVAKIDEYEDLDEE